MPWCFCFFNRWLLSDLIETAKTDGLWECAEETCRWTATLSGVHRRFFISQWESEGRGLSCPLGSGAVWMHISRRCNCTYPYWMQFGASKVDSRSNKSEGGKHQRAQTSEEEEEKRQSDWSHQDILLVLFWCCSFLFLLWFFFFASFLSDIQACTGGITLIPPPPSRLFKVCDKRVRRAMSL